MADYLKYFEQHNQYNTYITGNNVLLPNVSYCYGDGAIYYNPTKRIKGIINVNSTSSATQILNPSYISLFSKIWVDGVEQPNVISSYTFTTTGEHRVKYELVNNQAIGANAFAGTSKLVSIVIPNSVTSIGNSAFSATGLTSIVIPNSVTSIGENVFQYCGSLTSITIPNSVTTIGQQAFSFCSGLTSVTIGNGVTSISNYAFYNSSNLNSITCLATTAPTIQNNTFSSVANNGTLYVPSGSTGYNEWMSKLPNGWTMVQQ